MSLAIVSVRGRYGAPTRAPGPGVPAVAGPIVAVALTLPLAGPVPATLPLTLPQACQSATPNVALQVAVVDQAGNAVDVSAVTTMQLWLQAPDGTARAVPASFVDNGLDGLIQYVTTAVDLNEAGYWEVQAQLNFSGQVLRTAWGQFYAGPNIGG